MRLHALRLTVPLCAAVLALLLSFELGASPAVAGEHRSSGRGCAGGAGQHAGRMRGAGAATRDPSLLALRDLRALECLYRREHDLQKIEAMYRDVLVRSQHPLLRSVAYRRLARLAWRRDDAAAAEALLRESLAEKLK